MSTQVHIRRATAQDAVECGRIAYEAFATINRQHNFEPEIPSPEAGAGILGMLFGHPGFYCVVAEMDGRIAGSNCLDERSRITGIGPVTVDPAIQNRAIGRKLMQAVVDRSWERGFPGTRLVQSAFHNRSLALYAKMGFNPREPLSGMTGPPIQATFEGCSVRKAETGDIEAANRICEKVHGHDRGGDLRDAIAQGVALVVERHGRITGYAAGFGYLGHAVGEANVDIQALIGASSGYAGPAMLVPTRNADLLRWMLASGYSIAYPMTLMTMGLYNEPSGAYLPSILY